MADMPVLPDDVRVYRSTSTYTHDTVPEALKRAHTTKPHTWGRIVVELGRLHYRLEGPGEPHWLLTSSQEGIIPPQVPHSIEPDGPVRFRVEFLKVP